MEAADDDIDAACAKCSGHVDRARELIALDAYQKNDSGPGIRNFPGDPVLRDNRVALVPSVKG